MDYKSFQKLLLKWYQKNARALPWRETKDPYKIWVSEIMLQQTQVDTVIPYYQKWLKRFPTLKILAAAPQSKVLEHWAGLGYYRRARMLHQGAQYIIKELNGKVPRQPDELIKIPGIGKYTAGAIASIAFEERAPILDGNVIRILARLFAVKEDTGESKTLKKLWQLAEDVLPQKDLGDFNQAMMELGATICFPASPDCGACPVATLCMAHEHGKETAYPVKKNKIKIEAINNYALIMHNQDRVLVHKQPDHERWGGLWMFPFWQDKKEMTDFIGKPDTKTKKFMNLRHGYTKYKITLNVYELQVKNDTLTVKEKEAKWVTPQQLIKLALPSPHKRIAKEIIKQYD